MGKTPPKIVVDMTLKKSDGETPVMLEFWEMRRTLSLPLLPDQPWSRVVAADRVQSIGQIGLFGI